MLLGGPAVLLLLLVPLALLTSAVTALAAHGPLGLLGAAVLVLACCAATRWLARAAWRWWRSTAAPVRDLPVQRGTTQQEMEAVRRTGS